MSKRNRLFTIITIIFVILLVTYDRGITKERMSLEEIIVEVLKENRDLLAGAHNIEALEERPAQANSLPNPAITFGLMNVPTDSFDLKQEAMTQKTFGLMQTFPYPGKLGLKRDIAENDLLKGREELEWLKLRIMKDLKKAYFGLYFINRSIEVTKRNKALLGDFISIAEAKYSVGKGIQQDVLKAYVEFSKMKEKLIVLEEKQSTLKARLNYYMNRLPQEPLNIFDDIKISHLHLDVDELQKIADENHPMLRGMYAFIEKNKNKNLLAKKNYFPDFNVTLQYGQRDDGVMDRTDFVSAMVKMKVPLWHKNSDDRKVIESAARLKEAERKYESARIGLFFRIKKLKDQMESAYEQTLLFREGIIPQARASLESAIAGYQVNKVDFLNLLNNHLTLFNYEVQYYRSLADHETKMAELEEAVGGKLMEGKNEVSK